MSVWNWDEEHDMIYHGVNYGKCSDGNGLTFVWFLNRFLNSLKYIKF